MLILGIDPGVAATGYGIIETGSGSYRYVTCGCIKTSAAEDEGQRLMEQHRKLEELITSYRPLVMAVEQLFFNKNVQTAMAVGQARGVTLLTAARRGLAVVEYSPLQIKQAVAGYGRASKKQVQSMVRKLLGLEELPRPDHAADALAVALCHAHTLPLAHKILVSGGKTCSIT